MMTRVLIAMRGTVVSVYGRGVLVKILRSNVRTAEIRLISLVFVFGVSMPKPVVSGGSAHPTTTSAIELRVVTFDEKSIF